MRPLPTPMRHFHLTVPELLITGRSRQNFPSFFNHAVLSLIKYKDFQSYHLQTILSTALAASLLFLSSAMVRQTPFPRGRESHGLLPLPITKMLESQVAKLLHWHLSCQLHQKNQGVSLSLLVIIPVLPRLASLVTTHRLPVPNLMKAVTFPVSAISVNGVLHLDEGISIADDASIMGDQ